MVVVLVQGKELEMEVAERKVVMREVTTGLATGIVMAMEGEDKI